MKYVQNPYMDKTKAKERYIERMKGYAIFATSLIVVLTAMI